ncbi:hypothetical protein JZ751_029996 [Albula glossodonta]|uniref:Uncharacterized protein n=1 Tax=Albula glossodonta TaxID=121402 RepID=A0A8T2NH57_9TELE|nr:hypothetical protein JZ751_029996 [Albula glossodonta]
MVSVGDTSTYVSDTWCHSALFRWAQEPEGREEAMRKVCLSKDGQVGVANGEEPQTPGDTQGTGEPQDAAEGPCVLTILRGWLLSVQVEHLNYDVDQDGTVEQEHQHKICHDGGVVHHETPNPAPASNRPRVVHFDHQPVQVHSLQGHPGKAAEEGVVQQDGRGDAEARDL